MLSVIHQQMIIKMLGYWLRREFWERKDFKNSYKSESAYYKAIRYFEASGLVSYEVTDGSKYFFLTEKGIILARILCEMSDNPARIKRLSSLRKWDDLDMKMFGEGEKLNGK